MNQTILLNLLVASTICRQLTVQLHLLACKGEREGSFDSSFDLFFILFCHHKPPIVKAIPASSDTLKDYVLLFCHFKTDFFLFPGMFGQRLIFASRKTVYVLGKPFDSRKDLDFGFFSHWKGSSSAGWYNCHYWQQTIVCGRFLLLGP